MKNLMFAALSLFVGVSAHAADSIPDYYRLQPAKLKEVVPTAVELYSTATAAPAPTPKADNDGKQTDFTLDWNMIQMIGEKIIQIVQAGKPVVNITRDVVAVVPGGVTSWSQLSNWQAPATKVYSLTVQNYLGMNVVDMRLKVSANYGGGIDGKGKFIANLVVVPSNVSVLWGFSADVFSEHQEPVNVATADNPVAGLPFDIRYKYGSALKVEQGTQSYFVTGDGQIKEIQ